MSQGQQQQQCDRTRVHEAHEWLELGQSGIRQCAGVTYSEGDIVEITRGCARGETGRIFRAYATTALVTFGPRRTGQTYSYKVLKRAASSERAMTRDELAEWLRLGGVNTEAHLSELLAKYAGKTEDEMNTIYDAMHGDMA